MAVAVAKKSLRSTKKWCALDMSFVGGAVHGGLSVGYLRGGAQESVGKSARCGLELRECLGR